MADQKAYELAQALCRELADRPHLVQLAAQIALATAPQRHSVDFASIVWNGTLYTFTGSQAHAVRLLWAAMENGTPVVRQETLLARMNTRRVLRLFRDHPALGTMIVPGPVKGTYRLAANQEQADEAN